MAQDTLISYSLTFRDNRGFTARTSWYQMFDSTSPTAWDDSVQVFQNMHAALAGASNGQVVHASGAGATVTDISLFGATAQYPNCEAKARYQFLGVSRVRTTTISLPCPKLAVFYSGAGGDDEKTVDPTNALNIAILAAMDTPVNSAQVACGPVIDGIHSLIIGRLDQRTQRRKITRWAKNPAGSTPA